MISVTPGGGVKDPADQVTAELPGLVTKRGRGRPRKVDALTPAQRAKRYRDMQKLKAAADAAEARYRALLGRPKAHYCHQCGQTAVWGPRVACEVCWPFPVTIDA